MPLRSDPSKYDCDACALRPQCCPSQPNRKVAQSLHEGARDLARNLSKTGAYATSRREWKKVENPIRAHQTHPRVDRLRLRSTNGAKDEFLLAATAQNLCKMAKAVSTRSDSSGIPFAAPL
ncbi:transposase [Sphingobium sp. ba1]|uniref:transposase n=1 Tax=Sphingobium sp. ba1 TaxID=1522072 RepID=UPI0009715207